MKNVNSVPILKYWYIRHKLNVSTYKSWRPATVLKMLQVSFSFSDVCDYSMTQPFWPLTRQWNIQNSFLSFSLSSSFFNLSRSSTFLISFLHVESRVLSRAAAAWKSCFASVGFQAPECAFALRYMALTLSKNSKESYLVRNEDDVIV